MKLSTGVWCNHGKCGTGTKAGNHAQLLGGGRINDRTTIVIANHHSRATRILDETAPRPEPTLGSAWRTRRVQEQLGLKLVPEQGPVETLVIEHAYRPTPD